MLFDVVCFIELAGLFNVGINCLYSDEYKDCETYISPKYKNWKSEIMEYELIKNVMKIYPNQIKKK